MSAIKERETATMGTATGNGHAANGVVWEATIDDLYRLEGKAELVDGKILHLPLMGDLPSYATGEIFVSLRQYARSTSIGRASVGRLGFVVDLPNRRSFSPDAAFFTLPVNGVRFVDGTPDFAVEVRSEGNYGAVAESEMRAKRQDYFAAGTLAIWDVDLQNEPTIRLFNSPDAETSLTIFRRGEIAHAETAVVELDNGG